MAIVAGLLVILAATNRWVSWATGFRLLTANDEIDYRAIADGAPHLPQTKLQVQHAQRFAFHYLIGLIAHALGVRVETVYEVTIVVVIVALCVVLAVVLRAAGASAPVFATCMGVFVFNAYSLRYYVLASGEVADLLFEIGLLASLLGLLQRRYRLVLAGCVFATLARQTEVLAAVVTALWVAVGPHWSTSGRRGARAARAAGVVLASAAVYEALVLVAAPFSAHTTPDVAHFMFLADFERLPSGAGALAQHFLRSVNGLFSVGAMLGVLVIRRRRVAAKQTAGLPAEFFWCGLLGGSVVLQPVVFSAEYAAHNETRLSVLALGALVCALCFALRDLEQRIPLQAKTVVGLLVVMLVGSLHHIYTIVGTATASETFVLQAVAAVGLAWLLWRATSDRLLTTMVTEVGIGDS